MVVFKSFGERDAYLGENAMSLKLGIIGYPIGHSISPVFQQAALDHYGIDGAYQAYQVAPDSLEEFFQGLRQPDFLGINVTVPHKEAVIPYLDEVDDWAAAAGAVNTVVNRDGRSSGHNTDGSGFLRALKEGAGFYPKGSRVLVLGAGGAARGVVLALVRDGIAGLTVANRTLERAKRLADLAQSDGIPSQAIPLSGQELTDATGVADLIVNCTTVGMSQGPDENGSPLSTDQIPATALVNDLVYNPLETTVAGGS